MASEEERPTAESAAPKGAEPGVQDAPLTQAEFEAQMQRLAERARAAGLNPLRTMFHTYARRGMAVLEGILEGLEEDVDNPKKKGKK